MPEPLRKPGRPPILTQCVRCQQPRPRRDYVGTSSGVCKGCRREIRDGKAPSSAPDGDRAYTGQSAPVKPEIVEAIALSAVNASVVRFVFDLKLPTRCECCWETRHVARDGYGGVATLCARCAYQVCATGACHLHHSRVFYPELAAEHVARGASGPVPSPPEVEVLFYVPEMDHPKYDPAELADADV